MDNIDIIVRHIPTLSTDMLRSAFCIEVCEELTAEWGKMESKLWDNREVYKTELSKEEKEIFHANIKWYHKNISDVYLPQTINIYTSDIITESLEEINEALWDSDYSHYTAVEIENNKCKLEKRDEK